MPFCHVTIAARKWTILPMVLFLSWCAACAVPYKTVEKAGEPIETPPEETMPPAPPVAETETLIKEILPTIPYSIQVGAFSTAERAAAYAAVLQQSGLDAYYFVDADGLYKVRIERFDTRETAHQRAAELNADGLIDQYFIVTPLSIDVQDGQTAVVRDGLLQTARRFIGTPYSWGGASTAQGFDCSGLTLTVYRLNGLELPRSAVEQYRRGVAVPRERLEAGDLLFFDIHRTGRVSHVGIYSGSGRFIHAPGKGKRVCLASLSNAYFEKRYMGARRYY